MNAKTSGGTQPRTEPAQRPERATLPRRSPTGAKWDRRRRGSRTCRAPPSSSVACAWAIPT